MEAPRLEGSIPSPLRCCKFGISSQVRSSFPARSQPICPESVPRFGYDWALADVTDLLLAQHPHRTRNAGRAGWRVVLGDMTVLYDWPDGDDPGTARVVTLWRSD